MIDWRKKQVIQVKIIRCQANLMEERLNQFLRGLGSQTGIRVSLIDIKLYHIASEDIDTAMVIYNSTVTPNNQPKRPFNAVESRPRK